MNLRNKKVAIVHDFIEDYGGAEGVLEAICEIFPDAPIFTLLHNQKKSDKWNEEWIKSREIKSSFLEQAPTFLKRRKKYLLPFMPAAIESLNLRDYDLVISSCGAFSKGLVVKTKTIHICYLHSPMRYVWDWHREYLEENRLKGGGKMLTRLFLNYLRTWDRASADRPDHLIVNSYYTAARVKKYYRRSSKVIYPPVKTEDFYPQKENKGYFISVGRLSGYKRIDLIVDTFGKLKLPLVIVGQGSEMVGIKKKMKKCPDNNQLKLVGWKNRADMVKLIQNARAFVFAAEDDFGIAPIEAMAAGKPVIALRAGGAVETIKEGITGEFFDEPKMEMLADGIRKFIGNENEYDPEIIREQAEKFTRSRFKKEMEDYILSVIN
jgi:glycosyltransferase involved in cell wall biosynthesis